MGELTRVVNKHLLPVGAWPMIYYPLQLLQLAGVEEVMIVTGQGHAGQLIDMLGDRPGALGYSVYSYVRDMPGQHKERSGALADLRVNVLAIDGVSLSN